MTTKYLGCLEGVCIITRCSPVGRRRWWSSIGWWLGVEPIDSSRGTMKKRSGNWLSRRGGICRRWNERYLWIFKLIYHLTMFVHASNKCFKTNASKEFIKSSCFMLLCEIKSIIWYKLCIFIYFDNYIKVYDGKYKPNFCSTIKEKSWW